MQQIAQHISSLSRLLDIVRLLISWIKSAKFSIMSGKKEPGPDGNKTAGPPRDVRKKEKQQEPEEQTVYGPPPDPVTKGYEKDGIDVWCALANTEWGTIPGRASTNGICWYPYNGKEHLTANFIWISSSRPLERVWNTGIHSTPAGALPWGNQKDHTDPLYPAMAMTEFGHLPGKATNGTCWYSWMGREYKTTDFYWICTKEYREYGKPRDPVTEGVERDGYHLWCAVANTEWGTIPGKANTDGVCWYPHGGKEHRTRDFEWLSSTLPLERVKTSGWTPPGAIKSGKQNDHPGGPDWGYYHTIIADTEYGTIPGKASGSRCEYSYGGVEHIGYDYFWICTKQERYDSLTEDQKLQKEAFEKERNLAKQKLEEQQKPKKQEMSAPPPDPVTDGAQKENTN